MESQTIALPAYGFGYGCGYRKPHHRPLAYMESQTIALLAYGFGYGCGYRKPHHRPLAYMESQTIALLAYRAIKRGDILVTSSKKQYAMKVDDTLKMTLNNRYIVGVALQDFDQEAGIINVQR